MTERWKNRPEGSNWGDFGPDDQAGRMNLVTPERVLAAVREVKVGRSFCLSLPLEYPGGNRLNPRRFPPRTFATLRGDAANFNYPLQRDNPAFTDVISDDAVLLHTQYSTQWDSFAHVGSMFDADGDGVPEIVYYNGWRGSRDVVDAVPVEGAESWARYEGTSAKALGIENMARTGVQGRGVMIDLAAHYGRARTLVGYDELMRVCDADGVLVETGDMVCLHTDYGAMLLELKLEPDDHSLHDSCAVLNGRDGKLLNWITDSGLSLLISDNFAVEAFPSEPGQGHQHAALPLHEHCLFKLGIHLGELWHLSELARWLRQHKRSRFLLTAPPLYLTGAVGSPATPVATV